MEDVDRIPGAEQLVAALGYWPSFHDADVLEMRLNRRAYDEGCFGPTLEALIHTIDFEMTGQVGSDGRRSLRHSVLVRLRFHDVVELRLEGFNFQNKLHGLTISDIRGWQWERVFWGVRLDFRSECVVPMLQGRSCQRGPVRYDRGANTRRPRNFLRR